MKSYERKDFIHVSWPDLSIFQHSVLRGKKIFYLLAVASKSISLSNNVYSHIIKSNEKIQPWGEQLLGKQETQPLWGSLWEQGW